jgi:hypothetical protein
MRKELVMTADEHALIVKLEPGYPGDHQFTLRVTPQYEDELVELLRAQELYGGKILEHSDPATLLAIISVAVGAGGALTKLASILTAFIKRNEGKEIVLRSHTTEWRMKGYSRRDVERLIEVTANLQQQWDEQSAQLPSPGAAQLPEESPKQ